MDSIGGSSPDQRKIAIAASLGLVCPHLGRCMPQALVRNLFQLPLKAFVGYWDLQTVILHAGS